MQVSFEKEWRRLLGDQKERQALKALVPSKVDLSNVSLNVVSSGGNSHKVVFQNIDQALEEPTNDNLTRLKNAILAWCRRYGEARMSQGNDIATFEVIITQRVAESKAPVQDINPYEPFTKRKASIIARAVIGKK